MEIRKARMLVNKSGGTAGKGGVTFRVTLPTNWIRNIGLSENSRELLLTFKNNKIMIEKAKHELACGDVENYPLSGSDHVRTILKTEECKEEAPVLIYFNDEKVWAYYHKDNCYIDTVKKLEYKWSGEYWYKKTNQGHERASELGNKLLSKGYTVEVDDSIADMAVNATYDPECFNWIYLIPGGKYENWLIIKWSGKNDKIYNTARSLPGSKWDSGVVVRIEYFKEVEDFASLYDFKFSDGALTAIEKHKKSLESAKTVKPIAVDEKNSNGLKRILDSKREILDDLRDD